MDDDTEFITERFRHDGVTCIQIDTYDDERLTARQWWLLYPAGMKDYFLAALIPDEKDGK